MTKFIKKTIIAGGIMVIPLAVLVVILASTVKKLIDAMLPLTVEMAFGPLTNTIIAIAIVLIGIVSVFFMVGLIYNTFWGQKIDNWLESRAYKHIPLFSTLKQLTQRIMGIENSSFPVVEIDLYGTGVKVLGVVVEELADHRLMVYAPASPIVTMGQIYIVPVERANEINASIQDTMNCLSKIGLESHKVYKNTNGNITP